MASLGHVIVGVAASRLEAGQSLDVKSEIVVDNLGAGMVRRVPRVMFLAAVIARRGGGERLDYWLL